MRITLVRHGRSAHVHAGWLSAADVHAWRVAYDAAGLREGEQPPMPLRSVIRYTGASGRRADSSINWTSAPLMLPCSHGARRDTYSP